LGLAAIGCWSYVLNEIHTGHPLVPGSGESSLYGASPSFPGSLVTGVSMLYELMDLGPLGHRSSHVLALAGVIAAVLAGVVARRRTRIRHPLAEGASVAVPFLAPVLVIAGGAALAFATHLLGKPVTDPTVYGGLNNKADEDTSAFGPIGGVLLLAVPVATAAAYFARKVDKRQLALACALPLFVIVVSLVERFSPWIPRYLIVPVVLTAPLFAHLFRNPGTIAAYLAVSCVLLGLVLTRNTTKMLAGSHGPPWKVSWVQSFDQRDMPNTAAGLAALEKIVPADACVGAVLADDNPAYLISGRDFRRRVVFLPVDGAAREASRAHLTFAVVSVGQPWRPALREFEAEGWSIQNLGRTWKLATAPDATTRACG
jgi:hypothetical protein